MINKTIKPSFEVNEIRSSDTNNPLVKISCYNKHFVAIDAKGFTYTWGKDCVSGELGFGKKRMVTDSER